jgi:hypothetical protein
LQVRMVPAGLQVMLPAASAAQQEPPPAATGEKSGEYVRIAIN